MVRHSTKAKVFEKLIESLVHADAGSRELDIVVSFVLDDTATESGQMIRLLVEEGYAWDTVTELLDAELPSYTRCLDSRVPGENIVLAMYSAKRSRWAAVHRAPDGANFLAWAATESLARRLAALKGLRAGGFAAPRHPGAATGRGAAAGLGTGRPGKAAAPARPEPPEEPAEEDWKILF
ncbi:MAG: hypothetical protein ACE5KF_03100 [Kiloniellaceae bacterium]